MQNKNCEKLEFNKILDMLAENALSVKAGERCRALAPELNETACRRRMRETTGARNILDAHGSPPLTAMQDIEAIMVLCGAGALRSCFVGKRHVRRFGRQATAVKGQAVRFTTLL